VAFEYYLPADINGALVLFCLFYCPLISEVSTWLAAVAGGAILTPYEKYCNGSVFCECSDLEMNVQQKSWHLLVSLF
jgi:hypothetical protein